MSLVLTAFIKQHKLKDIVDKHGYVCAEVRKRMHGFPQAGMLSHRDLVKRITAHGHQPKTFTPGHLLYSRS